MVLFLDHPDLLLPAMLEEFPFLHVSPQTAHSMWQKQTRHLSSALKSGTEARRTKTQRMIEEAERRQEALVGILKKDLEHNLRMVSFYCDFTHIIAQYLWTGEIWKECYASTRIIIIIIIFLHCSHFRRIALKWIEHYIFLRLCLHFYTTNPPTHNIPTPDLSDVCAFSVRIFPILFWKWFHFTFLLSHVSARLDALRLALFFILQGANSLYFAGA